MCCLWLLLRFSSRVEQMWQTLWPTKLKIVTIWPLQKKFANPCCQPLHVDEHLAPLIMQLWKQAFTYSIVSCINKCIQSWDNFYVHFNIPYQICSHLIACFQDKSLYTWNLPNFPWIQSSFAFSLGYRNIKVYMMVKNMAFGGANKSWFKASCVTCQVPREEYITLGMSLECS